MIVGVPKEIKTAENRVAMYKAVCRESAAWQALATEAGER